MKRRMMIGVVALLILIAGTFVAFAGNGMGPGAGDCPNWNGNGTCPYGDCGGAIFSCSGIVEPVTGTVESFGVPGGGLVVETGTYAETVYGIGPLWYWERNDMDRPEIGETVAIEAEPMTVGSTTKKVIIAITIGDQTLVLRDAATCLPLWRGKRW